MQDKKKEKAIAIYMVVEIILWSQPQALCASEALQSPLFPEVRELNLQRLKLGLLHLPGR